MDSSPDGLEAPAQTGQQQREAPWGTQVSQFSGESPFDHLPVIGVQDVIDAAAQPGIFAIDPNGTVLLWD